MPLPVGETASAFAVVFGPSVVAMQSAPVDPAVHA